MIRPWLMTDYLIGHASIPFLVHWWFREGVLAVHSQGNVLSSSEVRPKARIVVPETDSSPLK